MEDLPSRSPGLDFYGLMGTGPKKGRVVSAFLPDVKLEFSEKKIPSNRNYIELEVEIIRFFLGKKKAKGPRRVNQSASVIMLLGSTFQSEFIT